MKIGDIVTFTPFVRTEDTRKGPHGKKLQGKPVRGRVISIHPRRGFFRVEYQTRGGTLRETLYFTPGEGERA